MSAHPSKPMQALARYLTQKGLSVKQGEPLSAHTTLSIGGLAALFTHLPRVALLGDVLQTAQELAIPVIVLGGGSNSLFPDEGFDGLVVKLFMGEGRAAQEGGVLTVDADVLLSRVVKAAAATGSPGFEGLAGIPGTVGGALVNNAGAYGVNVSDHLLSVDIAAPQGRVITLPRGEVWWGYRNTTFRRERLPIVRARFGLSPGAEDPAAISGRMREIQQVRRGKFLGIRSNAGSTFANPPGTSAGRLLEELGLKGKQVGQVRLSQQHANVMENLGGGTAADALRLLGEVEHEVKERTGITLQRELEVHGPATAGGLKHVTPA